MKLIHLVLICVLFASPSASIARVKPIVTYQQLLDKSDLVLIAEPSASADTNEKTDLPGINVVHEDNHVTGLPVIGVETKLRVLVILKGDKSLKEIVLHHYRLAGDPASTDGVMLTTFDPKTPHPFLLFLVREQDGRYAPLDQTDPAMQTVQRLETYLE